MSWFIPNNKKFSQYPLIKYIFFRNKDADFGGWVYFINMDRPSGICVTPKIVTSVQSLAITLIYSQSKIILYMLASFIKKNITIGTLYYNLLHVGPLCITLHNIISQKIQFKVVVKYSDNRP
jgi:hypothetical protein